MHLIFFVTCPELGSKPRKFAAKFMSTLFYTSFVSDSFVVLVVLDTYGVVYYASVGSSKSRLISSMAKDFKKINNYNLSSFIPKESLSIQKTIGNFEKLFNNPKSPIEIPYKFIFGTDLQRKVWKRLLEIPCGEVTFYEKLALEHGKTSSSRVIGNCVGANRIAVIIPCHRVITKSKKISGYRFGVEVKRYLLKHELGSKYAGIIG